MFIDFTPDCAIRLAEIHSEFASHIPGYPKFPPGYWDSIIIKSGIDPRDHFILWGDSNDKIDAFAWTYPKFLPDRFLFRGPYLNPQHKNHDEIIGNIIDEIIRRAIILGASTVQGRSLLAPWEPILQSNGFTHAGSYNRMRLFPLRGDIVSAKIQDSSGRFRNWESDDDLELLSSLFIEAFQKHWDYIPPDRDSLLSVIRSREFNRGLVLFGFQSNSPACFAFGESMTDHQNPVIKCTYLISFGVTPEFSGQGWGKAALSRWLRASYDLGHRSSELDVDSQNIPAISLYSSYGFKTIRSEKVWVKAL